MSAHNHAQALPVHVVDAVAAGTVGATLAGWLPPIAAGFAILWYGLQIWESPTVRGWLRRDRARD